MKKKITAICLVVALAAIAVIGGTLAYFTDTDDAANTFTVGSVAIELIEQQVNDEGTALEEFEQEQILMPIVGSAQGDKDQFGQPVAENYIDKIVTIKNTGKSDAYIRAYFAIPSALDDGAETFNPGLNILHFNYGNEEDVTTFGNQWIWKNAESEWNYFETTIGEEDNEVAYNVYYADYYKALPADNTTEQFISGVYLDKDVDMDEEGNYIVNGRDNLDLSILEGAVECPVFAVAVQAEGFDNATDAVNAAFGENFNPWAE